MDERSGTVQLVDSTRAFEERGLIATVSRAEVERAVHADEGPVDLLLDVERVASDGDGRETQRIALAWESQDLERLLEQTGDGDLSLTFDEGELRGLLDEDVEAHGMRETLAIVAVAAGVAAAGAGSALASPVSDGGLPGGAATPAASAQVTASEMSTGFGAAQTAQTGTQAGRSATASEISTGITGVTPASPSEVSSGIVQAPPTMPAEVTTGITAKPTATPVSADEPSWSPNVTEGSVVAGMIVALAAVGFAVRSQRGPRIAI